ncbi:Hypothetical predicted protein [Paramuricea clavata]|nr:Hypothetical predicted protein [Paramuricea clavata]
MNEQLKKFENGQQCWSPDHPTFMLYINKAEASRRNELLCDMRGQCLERWFLLQLMRKYADRQAIAKICGQITKTTNAIKKLVKQYGRKITEHMHSKYPPSVTFEEITDLNSTIWNCLEEEIECNSPVPYYIRHKIVDFQHIIHRCTEEVKLIKEEMTRVIRFYSSKISALQDWSDELKNESTESCGLLTMVLTKKDLINMVLQHLKASFSLYMDEDRTELEKHGDLPEEDRIFSTCSDDDEEEMELDDNGDGEDELEEDTLDLFISILNEEYGGDSDQSDVELSDDDLD